MHFVSAKGCGAAIKCCSYLCINRMLHKVLQIVSVLERLFVVGQLLIGTAKCSCENSIST